MRAVETYGPAIRHEYFPFAHHDRATNPLLTPASRHSINTMSTRRRQRFDAGTLPWALAAALGPVVFAAVATRQTLAILQPGVL